MVRATAMGRLSDIKLWEAEIAELQAKINDAKQSIADAKVRYVDEKARLDALQPIDIDPIETELNNVSATNSAVRANRDYLAAKEDSKAKEQEYDSLTSDIDAVVRSRKDSLSAAAMPIAGLTFDSDGLYYNQIPLDQCSDGEKLMVSLAISMALNPKLRVLRIKDGSLLDSKNRAIIAETVKDKGYQLWYESVGTDARVGILIEEGEVASIDGQPVEKKTRKQSKPREASHAETTDPASEPESKPEPAPVSAVTSAPDDW
jgi:hypothetical protein